MTRVFAIAAFVICLFCIADPTPAAVHSYQAVLGDFEATPTGSLGTGLGLIDYDDTAHTLHVHITFSGLGSPTTASHIHSATTTPGSGTAIVATTTPTFLNFPLGVTSGTYDSTLDETLTTSWNSAFITAHGGTTASAEVFFASSLANDTAYLNIHTQQFGGGEIRGFIVPVPEPATFALGVVGALGLLAMRARTKAAR